MSEYQSQSQSEFGTSFQSKSIQQTQDENNTTNIIQSPQQFQKENKFRKKQVESDVFENMKPMTKNSIKENYSQIQTVVEEMNTNLKSAFKKQEQILLTFYKDEMYKTQKNLNQLQKTMNVEELRIKMDAKRQKLEVERQKFLQEALEFSNKCGEFQDKLGEVEKFTGDIQEELQFLDEQLVFADNNNAKLKKEQEILKAEILKYDPNFKFVEEEDFWQILPKVSSSEAQYGQLTSQPPHKFLNSQQMQSPVDKGEKSLYNSSKQSLQAQSQEYQSPYCPSKISECQSQNVSADDISKARSQLAKQKLLNTKLKEFLNDQCFEQSQIEKIFLECVAKVKAKRKLGNKSTNTSINQQQFSTVRPVDKNDKTKNKDQSVISEITSDANTSQLEVPHKPPQETTIQASLNDSLKILTDDAAFSDFDKKQIMEEFFAVEEIKQIIYNLIIDDKAMPH